MAGSFFVKIIIYLNCVFGPWLYLVVNYYNNFIIFFQISVQCNSNEFQCVDGKACIDKSKTCDGYQDCGDDSDETSRFCAGKDDSNV